MDVLIDDNWVELTAKDLYRMGEPVQNEHATGSCSDGR